MSKVLQAKQLNQKLRKGRVRSVIFGTSQRPRLNVFRSNSHLTAQIIDDQNHKTLVSSSTKDLKVTGKKVEQAVAVGEDIAKKAIEKGIKSIVFDRGGYRYHGRVKALADSARAAGLEF